MPHGPQASALGRGLSLTLRAFLNQTDRRPRQPATATTAATDSCVRTEKGLPAASIFYDCCRAAGEFDAQCKSDK